MNQEQQKIKIGVISDTHGLLRPEALTALAGVHQIIHAGDVEDPDILTALQGIAPVTGVRGNVDRGTWAYKLPLTAVVEVGDTSVYVIHNIEELNVDPVAAGFGVVIFGHSHQPLVEQRDGVIYLNPGAAGRKRCNVPVWIAYLTVEGSKIETELFELEVA